MENEKKETKTLIVLTREEKRRAHEMSKVIFGKPNYSGLFAHFINNNYKKKEG